MVTLAQATSHSFADGLEFVNATDSIVAVEYVNIAAVTSNHKAAEEISISPVETTHSELTEVRVTSSDNPLLEDSNGGTVKLTKAQHSDQITSSLASMVDQTSSSSHSKSPNKWISVQAISPLPHRTSDPKKRRGNTMDATILTRSPYKIVVEERLKATKQNSTSVTKRLLVIRRNNYTSTPLGQELSLLRKQVRPAGNQSVCLNNQKHVRQMQEKLLNSNSEMTVPHIIVWYVVKHMKRRGFNVRNVNCGHMKHVQICPIQSTTSVIIAVF